MNHGFIAPWPLLIGLFLGACSGSENLAKDCGVTDKSFLDWQSIEPDGRPNRWLMAPADSGITGADAVSPSFTVPPEALANDWVAVVEQQLRSRVLARSDDGLQVEAAQTSATFGFVDCISAQVFAEHEGGSTLAVYSRSTVGYWDFGVNRSRVESWVKALEERVGASTAK